MEVKRGYQRTEVGVIPEEWETKKIREIGEVRGRVGWKGYTKKDLVPFGPYAIGAKHIDEQGNLDLSEPTCLSRVKFLESPEIKVETGDILIVQRGTIGKLVLIEKDIGEATINPSMVIVRTKNSSPGFIRYFLLSSEGQKQIILDTSTTGVPMISQRQIENFRIAYPPLSEQHAIAAALSDVDGLLGGLDRLIAKKRDLKQAAMQQLLTGQTRLPGFHGEWEVKRLGNIATCFSGGTPPTKVASYYGGDIPWITSGDLNKGYITEVEGRISQAGLANSAAQMVEANTLLIALYGATSGVTAISKIRAAINQAVLAVVPRHDDTSFLYFKLRLLKDWLISTYTQGGQPNLSGDIVKSVELPLPPLPEQTAIAEVLTEMDAELAALEQRREKTRALKQAMMQELLTGRTRLL